MHGEQFPGDSSGSLKVGEAGQTIHCQLQEFSIFMLSIII